MTKKKILIIDNCPTVPEMAKDALNISGYEVHTATSQIVDNQHILSVDKKHDLILIEIIMPIARAPIASAKEVKNRSTCLFLPVRGETILKVLLSMRRSAFGGQT